MTQQTFSIRVTVRTESDKHLTEAAMKQILKRAIRNAVDDRVNSIRVDFIDACE